MMKMGVPLDAAKQAMIKDGLDSTILDGDHNKPYVPPAPLKSDKRFSKYYKMLKMMIPRDAVKNGMIKDGFNPDILDEPVDAPLRSSITVEFVKPKPKVTAQDPKASKLPLNKDPAFIKYKKYFTMVKMGLPPGAAKNAMVKDGLANSDTYIMDLDPTKSYASQVSAGAGGAEAGTASISKSPKAPKSRRKKLDWKPIQQTTIDKNSIWGELAANNGDHEFELDMHEFDSLFVSRVSPTTKDKKGGAGNKEVTTKKKASVQVIDGKRAMNGGIVLARLKVPFTDVAAAINEVKEGVLTIEQLMSLVDCLADRDEKRKLEDFLKRSKGEVSDLCEAEKFMCAMMMVENPGPKIKSLVLKSTFSTRRNDVIEVAKFVETACDDVRMSFRLKKLLAIILKVGNQLNHGNDDHDHDSAGSKKVHAKAFTLESLLKLNQAKAFDKKTSILHYLVMLVKRNDESLLKFKEDLLSVSKAEKVQFSFCNEELGKLRADLKVLRGIAIDEAEKIRDSEASSEGLLSSASRTMSLTEITGQKTKLKTTDGTTHYDQTTPMDAEGLALTPIGRFAIDADEAWAQTKEYTTNVSSKFANVLKYFGEDEKLTPGQFFATLSKFIRAFDSALDDVEKDEKRKAREERLAQMKKDQEEKKKREKDRAESIGSNHGEDGVEGGGGGGGGGGDVDHSAKKAGHKKITAGRRASTMGLGLDR